MKTIKAIIKYIKLPKVYKGAVLRTVDTYYKCNIDTDNRIDL